MIEEIRCGMLEIKHEGQISRERQNPPVMLGALTCIDGQGSKIIVRTVSGNSRYLEPKENHAGIFYAPSIVSSKEIQDALYENDGKIHALTAKIDALPKSDVEEIKRLSKERTELTTKSLFRRREQENAAAPSFLTMRQKIRSYRSAWQKSSMTLKMTGCKNMKPFLPVIQGARSFFPACSVLKSFTGMIQ